MTSIVNKQPLELKYLHLHECFVDQCLQLPQVLDEQHPHDCGSKIDLGVCKTQSARYVGASCMTVSGRLGPARPSAQSPRTHSSLAAPGSSPRHHPCACCALPLHLVMLNAVLEVEPSARQAWSAACLLTWQLYLSNCHP